MGTFFARVAGNIVGEKKPTAAKKKPRAIGTWSARAAFGLPGAFQGKKKPG